MLDWCNTQKKFNKLLIDYWSNILHKVKNDWDTLSEDEKTKFLNVHEYLYGLHFLVALADTSQSCQKLWEGMVFSDPEQAGWLSHSSYSNGESGHLQLITSL